MTDLDPLEVFEILHPLFQRSPTEAERDMRDGVMELIDDEGRDLQDDILNELTP